MLLTMANGFFIGIGMVAGVAVGALLMAALLIALQNVWEWWFER